jgi:hypothetical protein
LFDPGLQVSEDSKTTGIASYFKDFGVEDLINMA